MNKILLGVLLLGGTLTFAAAQNSQVLTIGTGSTTGVYYPVGSGMAKLINDSKSGLQANVRSTSGSVDNLQALGTGDLKMAIAQSDVAFYALTGTGMQSFARSGNLKLRSMAILYPEVLHIIARKDARISSIPHLKGKRVIVGDPGSGTEQTAMQILDLYGLTFGDLGETIRVSPNQAASYLKDNKADAVFYTVGIGSSAINTILQATPVNLVPVAGAQATNLVKKFPFYVRQNIPANSYQGMPRAVPTVAVSAALMTTADVSEDTVYKAMKAIFDSDAKVKAIHPALANNFSYAKAVEGLPAPMHPGAIKFFTEKGIAVKD